MNTKLEKVNQFNQIKKNFKLGYRSPSQHYQDVWRFLDKLYYANDKSELYYDALNYFHKL